MEPTTQDITPSDIALQVYEHPMPKCCIGGFHSTRQLEGITSHAPCWLVNIHITWPFYPPVSMVKDAMESVYTSLRIEGLD